MPGQAVGDKSQVLRAVVPAIAAGATLSSPIGASPIRGRVVAVRYYATALMTGTALPNSRNIQVVNRGQAGAGVVVVCPALQFAVGVDAPANAPVYLPVTAANAAVVPGDVLDWVSTFDGTGLADPGGVVEIEIEPTLP